MARDAGANPLASITYITFITSITGVLSIR
jgi:hypothetical protein